MKIRNDAKSYESNEKRFYVPGTVIEALCPKCEKLAVKDLGKEYFMYPEINAPFDAGLYCPHCDIPVPTKVILRVTVDPVP